MSQQAHYLNEFDGWADLADSDPDAFENLRRELIDDLIRSAPEGRRQRLRCLQWRIEQERARSKTPLGACVRLTRMMWDKVLAQGGLVQHLSELGDVLESGPQPLHRASLLDFRRPRD